MPGQMLLLALAGFLVLVLRAKLAALARPGFEPTGLRTPRALPSLAFTVAAILLTAPILSCAAERSRAGPVCPNGAALYGCCIGHRGVDSVMEDGRVVCRDRTESKTCHCKARH